MGTVDRQLSAMHLQIISIGAVLTLVGAQDFIAPPDRIWFRQDALAEGQTCASQYEKVKDTDKVITGKGPIILPERQPSRCASSSWLEFTEIPPLGRISRELEETGTTTVARRVPVLRDAVSPTTSEETTSTTSGSKLRRTALTPQQHSRLPCTSQPRKERPAQCVPSCLERLERLSGGRSQESLELALENAAPSSLPSQSHTKGIQ